VDDDIPEGVDLLGKELDDLQSGVAAGASDITGTLKYVTNYTGFSEDPTEQQGNYIALHIDTDVEGATIVAELIGDSRGPVTLDSDRTLIARIKSKGQKIKITASKEGYPTVEKTFTLAGLTLETAS
jgi:hypothetical protein